MKESEEKTDNSQFWQISEALHVSSMGVGADPEDLLRFSEHNFDLRKTAARPCWRPHRRLSPPG